MSNEIAKLKSIKNSAASKEIEIFNMVKDSLLAKELSEIFSQLKFNGECSIDINNWLRLNLLIEGFESKIQCMPYESLLFKYSPKKLEPFIIDKSQNSVLFCLIKKCKYPSISFKSISEEEDIPFEAVREAACHFVRWNKAKIIPCLDSNSVFVNNSDFNCSDTLIKDWEKTFDKKHEDFLRTLSFFSSPKSMSDTENMLIGNKKAVSIITWLLRKNIIIDLHYYLYLFISIPMTKNKYFDEVNLSEFKDNSNEYEILLAISNYCTGNVMIEEIIAATGKTFQGISKCVSHYKNKLKMILH
jgi:Nitrogen Permease regulator of amino acid transport activity 3